MRVVHFALGAPGCIQYRNVNPCEYLNAHGHEGFVVETDLQEKEDMKKVATIVKNIADIVVVTRFNNWSGVMNLAHKYKKRVVYELDDNPDLNKNHSAKEISNINRWIERTKEMATAADAVTVTTEPLAEYVRQYNKNVFVTPNMVDYDYDMWRQDRKEDDRIVIGYFGGSSHLNDLRMVSGALVRIAQEFPQVDIHYGAVPTTVVTLNPETNETVTTVNKKNSHAKAMHRIFSKLKKKRKKALYPLSIEDYGVVYANFDIAIAPLTPDDFNKYKSNLKFLESSAYGIPIVASREYPYIESVDNSGGGFLATTEDEWYDALKNLVKSKKLRDDMGAKAKKYAFDNFDLEKNGKIYLDVYKKVMKMKPTKRIAQPIVSLMSK